MLGSDSRVEIHGFNIVGNAPTNAETCGNGGGNGRAFNVSASTDITISTNQMRNFYADGIYLINGFTACGGLKCVAPASRVLLTMNTISHVGRNGITIGQSSDVQVTANTLSYLGQEGIDVEPNAQPLGATVSRVLLLWNVISAVSGNGFDINANSWNSGPAYPAIYDLDIEYNFSPDHLYYHVGGMGQLRRVMVNGNQQTTSTGTATIALGVLPSLSSVHEQIEYATVSNNSTVGTSASFVTANTCPLHSSGNTANGTAVTVTDTPVTCVSGWQDAPADLGAVQFEDRTQLRTSGRAASYTDHETMRDALHGGTTADSLLAVAIAYGDSQHMSDTSPSVATSFATRNGNTLAAWVGVTGTLPTSAADYTALQTWAQMSPATVLSTYGVKVEELEALYTAGWTSLAADTNSQFVADVDSHLGLLGTISGSADAGYISELAGGATKQHVLMEMATSSANQTAMANALGVETIYMATLGRVPTTTPTTGELATGRASLGSGGSVWTIMSTLLASSEYAAQPAPFQSCDAEGASLITAYYWCTH